MKYCRICGAEIMDEAYICPHCGCLTENTTTKKTEKIGDVMKLVAKIFMIISCVTSGFLLIPLCWTVPMTVSYWKKVEKHEKVSTAFKVCALLFVNAIAGIIMLCDEDN